MSLVALAAVTGAAQFGAGVLGGMAQMREAEEMRRRRERAARFARDDASEDLQFQQTQMDVEDRSMRLEASVAQRGMDLQERALGEQAMEEHGMGAVAQAMRGVGGEGTQRSFGRQLNQSARAFEGLGLERTAAFGRERRAMEMMNLGRDQMFAGYARQTRDIQAFEQDTTSDFNMQAKAARDTMIAGAIEGATTAGLMMYRGGAFMKDPTTPVTPEAAAPRAQGQFLKPGNQAAPGTPSFNMGASWGGSPGAFPTVSPFNTIGGSNMSMLLNRPQVSPMLNLNPRANHLQFR